VVSKTKFVDFRDDGFWAYDLGLAVFLKHLIDVGLPHRSPADVWLVDAISDWRRVAVIPDIGLDIDASWSAKQLETFIDLVEQACAVLAKRDGYAAEEITSWVLLEDLRIFPRGHAYVKTAPVVELGRALIALIDGSLPAAPVGKQWLYGAPEGRIAI
jgi:hypothetical protein